MTVEKTGMASKHVREQGNGMLPCSMHRMNHLEGSNSADLIQHRPGTSGAVEIFFLTIHPAAYVCWPDRGKRAKLWR
jgi:hypothetical protein